MNKQLHDQVNQLTLEVREMRRLLFGAKSERFVPESSATSAQLDLQLLMQEAAQPAITIQKEEIIVQRTSLFKNQLAVSHCLRIFKG